MLTRSKAEIQDRAILSIKNIKHSLLRMQMIGQSMNQPPEQPLYSAYEAKKRALIPKMLSLLLLAFLFYLGVLVNISLIELDAAQETILKTGALLLLAALIIIGTLLTYLKTRRPYLFYRNRVAHGKETMYYVNITSTSPSVKFFDKIFKTYSIQLGKKFFIRNISETIQLSNYLQKLIEFARKNQ